MKKIKIFNNHDRRVWRSNKALIRCINEADKKKKSYHCSKPKHFWYSVQKEYYKDALAKQKRNNKLNSLKDKKNMYILCIQCEANDRNYQNKYFGENSDKYCYVPPKLRKK